MKKASGSWLVKVERKNEGERVCVEQKREDEVVVDGGAAAGEAHLAAAAGQRPHIYARPSTVALWRPTTRGAIISHTTAEDGHGPEVSRRG